MKLPRKAVAGAGLLLTAAWAHAAPGDVVHQLTVPVSGSENHCSVGVTTDGAELFYDRCADSRIYRIDPLSGSLLGSFDTALPELPNCLAYDATRDGIWIGGQDCNGTGMPISFWSLASGAVTGGFDIPVSTSNPATGSPFVGFCFCDGLAFNANDTADPSDDEIWFSDDINHNIGVFRPDGTLVAGYDAGDVDPSLINSTSGLAVGGDDVYLSNHGGMEIFRASVVGGSLAAADFFAIDDPKGEGMSCDPVTFAPTEVLWVRTTPQSGAFPDVITAYEIAAGSCGLGGIAATTTTTTTTTTSTTTTTTTLPSSSCGPIPQGSPCDDVDPCTDNDRCQGGVCFGEAVPMYPACQWAIVAGNPTRRVLARLRADATVGGDVCGGRVYAGRDVLVTGDLVSGKNDGRAAVAIGPRSVVVGDVVTAGGGVLAKPPGTLLEALDPTPSIPPDTVEPKTATTVYDTTGDDARVPRCRSSRNAFHTAAADLAALPADATIGDTSIADGGSFTIAPGTTPGVVAGVRNVVDVERLTTGRDATIMIGGGGSPATTYVIRIHSRFSLKAGSRILLTAGLEPNRLVFLGSSKCRFGRESVGAGTVVCPDSKLLLDQAGAWEGAFLGGRNIVRLRDGAQLTHVPLHIEE